MALERARAELTRLTSQGDPLEHIKSLRLELGTEKDSVRRLRDELRRAKAASREQREALRQKTTAPDGSQSRRDRFDDAAEWVRHEVLLAWIDRYSPDDRRQWPLTGFAIGERFGSSLEGLTAVQLEKSFRTVVDVVTGRIRKLPHRGVHPLREGTGAEEQDVVRGSDGARCLRVYVETNTPSARRLHYWMLPDGTVELSRVVLHDDMQP